MANTSDNPSSTRPTIAAALAKMPAEMEEMERIQAESNKAVAEQRALVQSCTDRLEAWFPSTL